MTATAASKDQKRIDARILYDACPLCASKKMETLLTADCSKYPLYDSAISPLMTWKKCLSCTHIFTDGYFTEAAEKIIFSKTHPHQKVGFDVEGQRHASARMIEKVLPFARDGGWLDVGFGNGNLLFTAHEYGFTPVGIDLREENVELLRKTGIEAHCVDLRKFDRPQAFNVISMADVLEHVPYPKEILKPVHGLLGKDGVLFLSMPNADSILWQLLNGNNINPYWAELEHFHNFGRMRLYSLLRECGFEPVRYGISERYRVCMEVIAKKIA